MSSNLRLEKTVKTFVTAIFGFDCIRNVHNYALESKFHYIQSPHPQSPLEIQKGILEKKCRIRFPM